MEFGHALVTEVIADVRAEKSPFRFRAEESLIIHSREIEVTINIAGIAESQIQDLLRIVMSSRREHLRFQRQPFNSVG